MADAGPAGVEPGRSIPDESIDLGDQEDLTLTMGDTMQTEGTGNSELEQSLRNRVNNFELQSSLQKTGMTEDEKEQLSDDLRRATLHLIGVDEMSTDDILAYVTSHVPDTDVRVEWVNDTAFWSTDEESLQALQALQGTPMGPTDVTEAKVSSAFPLAKLQIRAARLNDRKTRGARERSRYYLFHPPESELRDNERRHSRYGNKRRRAPRERSRSPRRSMNDLFPDKVDRASRSPGATSDGKAHETGNNGRDLFPSKFDKKPLEERWEQIEQEKPVLEGTRQSPAQKEKSEAAIARNRLFEQLGSTKAQSPNSLAARMETSSEGKKKRAHQF